MIVCGNYISGFDPEYVILLYSSIQAQAFKNAEH